MTRLFLTRHQRQEIAEAIVADLMTNGDGKTAERLVLELPDKRDGGGWGKYALIDRIFQLLERYD